MLGAAGAGSIARLHVVDAVKHGAAPSKLVRRCKRQLKRAAQEEAAKHAACGSCARSGGGSKGLQVGGGGVAAQRARPRSRAVAAVAAASARAPCGLRCCGWHVKVLDSDVCGRVVEAT